MLRSDTVADAFSFGEKILGLAIDTVGAANVPYSQQLGTRDPKIVALALLCRTISNFKGAMILMREGLVVEARVLTRCCFENLFWVAALEERGAAFVNEMLSDDAANKRALGEMTLKLSSRAGADMDNENAKRLRELIGLSNKQFPNGKKLTASKTALGGSVEIAYSTYGHLSLEAVHPSITALGRHVTWEIEGDARHLTLDVVPSVRDRELLKTIWWCCDALIGVAIGTNQIIGGSPIDENLREGLEELRHRSIFDLES